MAKGDSSDWETPNLFTIRSRERWAEVWGRLFANHFPPPARPAVDFANGTVIAAMIGWQRHTGHVANIERVSFTEEGVEVMVSFYYGVYGGWAISHPYHVVVVNGTWEDASYRVDHVIEYLAPGSNGTLSANMLFVTGEPAYEVGSTVEIGFRNGLAVNVTLPCDAPGTFHRFANGS